MKGAKRDCRQRRFFASISSEKLKACSVHIAANGVENVARLIRAMQ